MTATRARRLLVLLVWLVALGAALAALLLSGHGGLAGPRLAEPRTWPEWARARPPDQAFVALVRLGTLGLGAHLLAVTVAAAAARAVDVRPLARAVDGLTPRFARPVLHALLGTGVVASAVVVGVSPANARPAAPFVTMTRLREPATNSPPPALAGAARPSAPTWRVRPGDSLWAIARDVVALRMKRTPTDGEVARYWARLVEVNRAALEHPDDPDLVFPGQDFRLP
jgi:hypothetical protein